MAKILILGGYGNFGKRIAQALTEKSIPVIIAGRSKQKAEALCQELGPLAEPAAFDIFQSLPYQLQRIRPAAVVNTCGPFQGTDYTIAKHCISNKTHYIDIADARKFVTDFNQLNTDALDADISLISGASTVPGLSSAVIEHYKSDFLSVDSLKYGIAPGQKAERGLATTLGIMSYVGKPLKPFKSIHRTAYGWQNLYRQDYPELGKRWMANCEIPDLDLFPEKYNIKKIQFSAGLELGLLHVGLWGFSWIVRLGFPLTLKKYAKPMLSISNYFDRFGSSDGGMHIIIQGKDLSGKPLVRKWFLIAKGGYGPYIPTIPAVILAEKLYHQQHLPKGAYACVGHITLAEYLSELKEYPIYQVEN